MSTKRHHRRRRQLQRKARVRRTLALTHLHEELPLLHQGLASLAALLDHPAARQTRKHKSRERHTASSPGPSRVFFVAVTVA